MITVPQRVGFALASVVPGMAIAVASLMVDNSAFGTKPLSPEWEAKTRAILKEMGMENWETLKLCRINKVAVANTIGVSPGFARKDTIFIDETTAKLLSDEEYRFLIGHEASHIVYGDERASIKAYGFLTLAFYGAYTACSELSQWLSAKKTGQICSDRARYAHYTIGALVTWFGFDLVYNKLRRVQEARADKNSLESLNCAQGCIDFWKNYQKKHPKEPYALFSTHPSYAERIKMAEKYQTQQTNNTHNSIS